LHAASKLTGVHCTLHGESTSTVHMPLASTSILPQAPMPARAGVANNNGRTKKLAATEPKAKDLFMIV